MTNTIPVFLAPGRNATGYMLQKLGNTDPRKGMGTKADQMVAKISFEPKSVTLQKEL